MSKTADQVNKVVAPKPPTASPTSHGGELDTPQSEASSLHNPVAAPPPVMRNSTMLALQRRVGNQAVQQMMDKKKRSLPQQAGSALQTRGGDLVGKPSALPQQQLDAVKAADPSTDQKHDEQLQPNGKLKPDTIVDPANRSLQTAQVKSLPEQAAGKDKPSSDKAAISDKPDVKQTASAALSALASKATFAAKPSPMIKAAMALETATKAAGIAGPGPAPAPTAAEPAPAQAVAPEVPSMGEADAGGPATIAEDPALESAAVLSNQVESPLPQEDYSAALDSVGESVGGSGGGGGGGGGGSAIANKPVPPAPNVASAPPAQAMAAMQGLPPLQLHEALTGVSASATNFVDKEQAQLAAQPPQMQRPSGAPAQHGAPATRPEAPSAKGDAKVERAPEGKATPVAKPKPLPAAPPNPAQRAAPPTESKDLPASINNIPTTDPGMALRADPAPNLELTGNADPSKTEEQQSKLLSSVQKTHGEGKADAAQPMGENDIFPVVPAEVLKAEVPGGAGGGAAAGKAAAAVGGAAAMDDQGVAISAIAQEQSGPVIQSAVAKAQGEINAKQQEHATKVTSERSKSSQEIDQLIADNSSAQTGERTKALQEVQQQRSSWNQEQTKLVTDAQTESAQAKAEGLKTIQQEQAQADQEAAQHIEQGNVEAAEAQRQGEQEAKQEQERGKSEANSGGFFGWLADKAQGFFDGIKQAIKSAIDKARSLIRSAIEKAKQLAVAAIEKARQAVVMVIRTVGDTLIKIGDRVLAGFPALRDKFRSAIKGVVQKAEQAVNALADKLKDNVKKALDKVAKAIDTTLNLLEQGLTAVVDGVKGVVDGAIKAAKAYISALGTFAAIIGDIVPNPGQWLSNLGKGANDGVRNHLWNAFQTQVKSWFQTKLDQVLGLGQSVWTLLKKGGITLAQIGSMVWQALQAVIPEILRDLLIEKLVSMIVPAAGTVKLIIEGLQAAWGSIGSIMQAIDQFVKFLKAVKGGNSGPAFASALSAAAIAVIDFVSNWLLQRLQNKAVNTVGKKIRALADKIAGGVQTAVKATKQLGSNAASKLKSVFGGKHVDVDAPHAPKSRLDADGQHGANKRADADTDARKQQDKENDKQRRWALGTAAIKALPAQSRREIGFALGRIKSSFGFDTLKPVDVGNHWQVSAVMRNATTIDVPEKEESDRNHVDANTSKHDHDGDAQNSTRPVAAANTHQQTSAQNSSSNVSTDPKISKSAALAKEKGYPEPPLGHHWVEIDGSLVLRRNPGFKGRRYVYDQANNRNKQLRRRRTSNQRKGEIGERQARSYMQGAGCKPLKGFKKNYHGIDMIYVKPGRPPEYIIVESKYGTSQLGRTSNGRQMSRPWVENNLAACVGADRMSEIVAQGYKRWVLRYNPVNGTMRLKEVTGA